MRSGIPTPKTFRITLIGLAAFATFGCSRIETVLTELPVRDLSPHEAYAEALDRAGLEGTPLVAKWRAAGDDAIRQPVLIDPPFREVAFYPGEEPSATAYEISLARGQRLQVAIDLEPTDTTGIFLDVFQREDGQLRRVASASPGSYQIEYQPSEESTLVVRVQPEVLRSVRVTMSVLRGASLAFPVQGRGRSDIGSRFGASREGGRRAHHGVDIFAPRGTPVVAATRGRVSRVERTNLGGLVVWLRDDERRESLYYAHLDRQLVVDGDFVEAGDTLGLVGNTGNARTTPPHLHFGIYARRRGPVNPYPYVVSPPSRAPSITADSSWLEGWARLRDDATITGGPADLARAEASEPRAVLPRYTVVRVLGAFGRTLRVRLPDGRQATLRDASLESLDTPIEELTLAAERRVLHSPDPGALPTGEAAAEVTLPVLGHYGSYRLVRPQSGAQGWVAASP